MLAPCVHERQSNNVSVFEARTGRFFWVKGFQPLLGKDFLDQFAVHIGESKVTTCVMESQLLVIESQAVKQSGCRS